MPWHSPEDAMPWVGLYDGVASLVCTLAMAVDAFQGFRQRKLWFPCRFFTINAATITLIAIAMKLPVDLTTDISALHDQDTKLLNICFLFTMLANFLPSLGLMNDKELLMNITAFSILIITIMVNVFIQSSTQALFVPSFHVTQLIFTLLWLFSVALMVPTSRKILEFQYAELHKLTSTRQERKFPSNELERNVKKYWMMAETGNPQFVIACSPICSASGVICSLLVIGSFDYSVILSHEFSGWCGSSNYKWSTPVILVVQSIGIVVGGIAPIFRCVTAFRSFNFSAKWSINHLNVFRVEKHWTQRLQKWKHSYVCSHIPGRHCKQFFHNVKNIILNFCIALQIMVVVMCKIMRLVPSFLVILFSYCYYFYKLFVRRMKDESIASSDNVRSEMEEYTGYVLQVEKKEKLSKGILRNTLKSITEFLRDSEEKEPSKLIKLLEKSTGFNGVAEYDNDKIPPLHPEEIPTCWSLVAVTLTAIAIAIPNITNGHVKGLLSSVGEGLQYIRHIEESLNANRDLVNARKAAKGIWTKVEVSSKWLEVDLQKKAHKAKTSQEILQWLGDEAVKVVIQSKRNKSGPLGNKFLKFIAAISMYRMTQTILLHCGEQENWPSDEEIFDWISTMIADILWASFTNLPRVISMKCHESAIEKREKSIQIAAQILGKTKKILTTLQERQLPGMDLNSMAYIDEWHALVKSQSPSHSSCSSRIQPASSICNDSLVVTIV